MYSETEYSLHFFRIHISYFLKYENCCGYKMNYNCLLINFSYIVAVDIIYKIKPFATLLEIIFFKICSYSIS